MGGATLGHASEIKTKQLAKRTIYWTKKKNRINMKIAFIPQEENALILWKIFGNSAEIN